MISLKASEHPLKSVTIFQSSTAELTRTFAVDLQSGRNTVEIYDLSSAIDTESPRIHGLGTAARVFDVSCNLRARPSKYRDTKNLEAIKAIAAKRETLLLEHDVRQEEYEMLKQLSPEAALTTEASARIDTFADNVVRRKRDAKRAVLEYVGQIEELDDELWTLQNTHKGETAARVVATILTKHECRVEFQLTYLVTGVKWQPHYDLHASTADGKPSSDVVLLYCANISQNTGEDWNDTMLTLSTASSQALKSLSIPKLVPLKVFHAQDASFAAATNGDSRLLGFGAASMFGRGGGRGGRGAASTRGRGGFYGAMMGSASETRLTSNEEEDEGFAVVAPEDTELGQSTSVDRSPLSLAYRVEGTVSLPSDGIAHKVSITMLEFSAELKYVCVPRKTTSAFIEGTVKNTSEYELLAGPVSVFMDDGFVTKTSLSLIGVNESFNCVLGVDTALKVSYNQRSVTSQEPPRSFAEPTKTTTRTITATVTNGHQFDISALIVRDGIPLGDADANIKVMLRKPDGLAQAKDGEEVPIDLGADVKDAKVRWSKVEKGQGGEKDGMYEWVCGTVVAGKEVNFETEWDIQSPINVRGRWEET